jgi:hypothetical protein
MDDRLGSLGGIDNVFRRLIKDGMVVGLHPDPNSLVADTRHQGLSFRFLTAAE